MTEVLLSEPDAKLVPREPWVLVLGGATRQGNRWARRACEGAVELGYDVVWLDGFEEREDDSNRPATFDPPETDRRLTIIRYSALEDSTLARRLMASHSLRRRSWTRWIWKKITRRIGLVLLPRAGWQVLGPILRGFADTGAIPSRIVYCDDYALTTAWHAARIWATCPVAMDLGGVD